MLNYYNNKMISLISENNDSFANDLKNKLNSFLNKHRYLDVDTSETLKIREIERLGAVFDNSNRKMFVVPENLEHELFKKYWFRVIKRRKKIDLDLLPSNSWWVENSKRAFKPSEWTVLKNRVCELSKNKCEICNDDNRHQHGEFKNTEEWCSGLLYCHEKWEYDVDNGIQKLIGFMGLCKKCYLANRVNFITEEKLNSIIMEQILWVNEYENEYDLKISVENALSVVREREKINWKIDLSFLQEDVKYRGIISNETFKKLYNL